tara:strand:+ start:1539 stop:2066 length:528 start_codon:yes stop_codon:yes gene_type:complete
MWEMPNWCDNSVILTHKDKSKLLELSKKAEQNSLFGFVLPEPDYDKVKVKKTYPKISDTADSIIEYADPKEAWWDWRVQNWGTKWEAEFESDLDTDTLTLRFDSAWSPPVQIYRELHKQGFGVEAGWLETGCDFCGVYINGREYDYRTDNKSVEQIPEGHRDIIGIEEYLYEEKN